MTAKEFVKLTYPNAKSEKHKGRTGFRSYTYYLIRIGDNYMWFAEGETEAKAWKQAKENILNFKKP